MKGYFIIIGSLFAFIFAWKFGILPQIQLLGKQHDTQPLSKFEIPLEDALINNLRDAIK